LVKRPIYVFRELSKMNETLVVYTKLSSSKVESALGEFVMVAGEAKEIEEDAASHGLRIDLAVKIFYCLTNNSAFEDTQALSLAASALSLDESAVRKAVKKARIAQRRREEALS
jgi:hypothetical protein